MSNPALSKALSVVALLATGGAGPAQPPAPVVVELFTSQGCSSCPPANAALNALADRPDVIALSFGVTYWDRLGWTDTFGSRQYTDRQWDYARALRHDNVWTPQVVVGGRADTVGQTVGQIEPLIRKARIAQNNGPAITLSPTKVAVAAGGMRRPADVWLVRYDPRTVDVPIQRGENGGKTLPHRNVVHQMVKLGVWNGPAASFTLPPSADTVWRTAILIQTGPGGAILSAVKG